MNFTYKKQQGFSILAVILLIIVIVVSIGGWLMSGTVNSNVLNNNKFEVEASLIMEESVAIKNVYTQLTHSGADSSQITFMPRQAASSTNFNLLDPEKGVKQPTIELLNSRGQLSYPESLWVFNNTGFSGMNVGTTATDPVMLLAGLSDDTCKIINTRLYNNTNIPKINNITNGANWVAGAANDNPNSTKIINLNSFSTAPFPDGWTSGCLAAGNLKNNNVYFYILKIN